MLLFFVIIDIYTRTENVNWHVHFLTGTQLRLFFLAFQIADRQKETNGMTAINNNIEFVVLTYQKAGNKRNVNIVRSFYFSGLCFYLMRVNNICSRLTVTLFGCLENRNALCITGLVRCHRRAFFFFLERSFYLVQTPGVCSEDPWGSADHSLRTTVLTLWWSLPYMYSDDYTLESAPLNVKLHAPPWVVLLFVTSLVNNKCCIRTVFRFVDSWNGRFRLLCQ